MIPKEWEGSNFYADLGISRGATQQEIRRAYRLKVRQYHPDVYHESDYSEQVERIALAYEVLRDSYKRSEYDSYLLYYYYCNGTCYRKVIDWRRICF